MTDDETGARTELSRDRFMAAGDVGSRLIQPILFHRLKNAVQRAQLSRKSLTDGWEKNTESH